MSRGGDEILHTTSTAARRLGKSEDWVRELFDTGRLHGQRDAAGRRLIPESEIDRMRQKTKNET